MVLAAGPVPQYAATAHCAERSRYQPGPTERLAPAPAPAPVEVTLAQPIAFIAAIHEFRQWLRIAVHAARCAAGPSGLSRAERTGTVSRPRG